MRPGLLMKMIQLEKNLTMERDDVDVVKRELVECVQKISENDDLRLTVPSTLCVS